MSKVRLPFILTAMAMAFAPSVAAPAFYSDASVFSPLPSFPDQGDGGWDIPSVELSGFAEWTPPLSDYTQGFSGLTRASAEDGQLIGNLIVTAAVDAGAPQNRKGGAGSVMSRVISDHPITAGTSGLADGDPVQVRFQVRIQGRVEIGGAPSGLSIMQITARTNIPGAPRVDYSSGGLNPPQDFEVDEYHDYVVDAQIGQTVQTDTLMSADMNGTAWPPGTVDRSFMLYVAEVRISHAPGFEAIGIDSDAGAPVVPLISPTDADGDGVANATDNCIVTPNPTQLDTNGDNYGNACDPDLDNNCLINFGDLALFRSAFHPRPYDADADFDGDGFVNFGDLSVVRQFFLASPGPTNLTNACDPAPFTSGGFTANAGGGFDLDLGMATAGGDPPSDVFWRTITALDAMLVPVNGATLALMGPTMPSYADCVAAPLGTIDTDLWRAGIGTWFCATTNEDRPVRFQITAADDADLARATTMDLAFTTWP